MLNSNNCILVRINVVNGFFLMKLDGVMCDEVFRAHVYPALFIVYICILKIANNVLFESLYRLFKLYPVISGKLAWNHGMRRKLLMINSHDSFIADFNVPNNCWQISKWGGRRPNNK